MKKDNFYKIIIVVLLLLNLGTLGFLLWRNPQAAKVDVMPIQKEEAPLRYMADELGLDEAQFAQLRKIARQHGRSLDSIQQQITHGRTSLYLLAKSSEIDTAARNKYLKQIEANESAKHIITLAHFQEIRAMLTEEQKERFNVFVEDMARHMARPPNRRRGPHKGRRPAGPPPMH